jgi:hypothetical protein
MKKFNWDTFDLDQFFEDCDKAGEILRARDCQCDCPETCPCKNPSV